MVEGKPTPPQSAPLSARLRRFQEANPDVLAIALYAIVTIAAVLVAYWAIFSQFAPYDDEGTLLVTVKAFVHGDALYHEIWSVYGPFYYELFGAFFKLTGSAVTTDASRTIVIVIWVGTSLLYGLVAQRLTGYLALGISGMIVAFAGLGVLTSEPMHPQGLCSLLVAGIALLVAVGPRRRVLLGGAGVGALAAALLLTKVNLGLFAIAAIVLAASLTLEWVRSRRWLQWLVIVGFAAMAVLVLARDFNLSWVREILLLELLATAAVLLAARSLRVERPAPDGPVLLRWLLAGVAGFVVAFVVIIAIVVATGPSLADVYHGVVTQAFGIRDVLKGPLPFPAGTAIAWAVGAVAAAAVASHLRPALAATSIWSGILRALVGLAIWLSIARIAPITIGKSSGNPDLVPLLLAWVAVIPPVGAIEGDFKRFARLALALLAVAETLQVYPVAGSQMGIAATIYVPVGAICLGDALTDLRAWSAARGGLVPARLATSLAIAGTAIGATFALLTIVLPGASNLSLYRDQQSLRLPGAELLHLPAATDETYEGVVDLLHKYRCTTFVGYANVPSFYLWSGIEAPKPQIPNAWMKALDHDQQQQVVEEMKASPRPCLLVNPENVGFYLGAEAPPPEPLVEYVLHGGFAPVAKSGGFQLFLPGARARKVGVEGT